MESSSPGLLKNGKINLCTSTRSLENKQNKVNTQLWDTLYDMYMTNCLTFGPAADDEHPQEKESNNKTHVGEHGAVTAVTGHSVIKWAS